MTSEIEIRPYRPADREAVRDLCCEAAFGRERVESYGLDRELFADLMTCYYLQREPESAWVAASAGQPAGYLMGARDTSRQRRETLRRFLPGAVGRFLLRGGAFRWTTWRVLLSNLGQAFRRRGAERELWGRLPAHLHLAVAEPYRGKGVGERLVLRFLADLQVRGVTGAHASVRSDNPGARRFFERLGFEEVARLPALRLAGVEGPAPQRIVYGREP